jgi:hypothetical protein
MLINPIHSLVTTGIHASRGVSVPTSFVCAPLLTRVRIGHHLEFEMQIPLWGILRDPGISISSSLRPGESRTNAARDVT